MVFKCEKIFYPPEILGKIIWFCLAPAKLRYQGDGMGVMDLSIKDYCNWHQANPLDIQAWHQTKSDELTHLSFYCESFFFWASAGHHISLDFIDMFMCTVKNLTMWHHHHKKNWNVKCNRSWFINFSLNWYSLLKLGLLIHSYMPLTDDIKINYFPWNIFDSFQNILQLNPSKHFCWVIFV